MNNGNEGSTHPHAITRGQQAQLPGVGVPGVPGQLAPVNTLPGVRMETGRLAPPGALGTGLVVSGPGLGRGVLATAAPAPPALVPGVPVLPGVVPAGMPTGGQVLPIPGTVGAPGGYPEGFPRGAPQEALNIPAKLEVPFFFPISKEPDDPADIVVPLATPLGNGETVLIEGRLPDGDYAGFTFIGYYAWLAVVNEDEETRGTYPLIFVNPDVGAFNDSPAPITPPIGPPDFQGPMEGHKFLYSLQVAQENVVITNHGHMSHELESLPFDAEVPKGSAFRLFVQRDICTRFYPDSEVYLFFGLFGSVRYNVVPPFRYNSSQKPVRIVDYASGQFSAPPTGDTGQLSRPVGVDIPLTHHHPTLCDTIKYTGDEHVFVKVSWQTSLGQMSFDFIPARLFKRFVAGGRLPQEILLYAPTTFNIEVAQAIINGDQGNAEGAFTLDTAAYGY